MAVHVIIQSGTIASGLLLYVAAMVGSRLRQNYLKAILRQVHRPDHDEPYIVSWNFSRCILACF
jgi:hypothetical protein